MRTMLSTAAVAAALALSATGAVAQVTPRFVDSIDGACPPNYAKSDKDKCEFGLTAPVQKTAPVAASNDACKNDWHMCADNSDLFNNNSGAYRIHSACMDAAGKLARYGEPKWPYWLNIGNFGRFYKGDNYVTSGRVTAIEPNAQFQNGFGAMVHVEVTCIYDLNAGKVIDIQLNEQQGGL
jgi:hypothetical protein